MKKLFFVSLALSLVTFAACNKVQLTQEVPKQAENENMNGLENMSMDDMSDIEDLSEDGNSIMNDMKDTEIEDSTKNNEVEMPPKTLEDTKKDDTNKNQSAVHSITLNAFEFGYDNATLKLKAGEKVKLTFNNTGKMKHDYVIEGTSIRTPVIEAGKSTTLEFTAPAKGAYKGFCSVGAHRAAGMENTIVVE